ncbi:MULTISPECIES: PA-phosphatase [Mycolicibacterium]|uniref:Phosphoesterase, PA-phosphatase related protein n=1 Tax=Mycolicibacterium gilvum (strain PYR-GCK) TaxID=350054 RepID=A4T2X4_MYCGI|nr:PA-phosphatase [Mycolicibacterium sp. PAM1]ABP42628.1 phosphoesterase, PA-phosphatase related protein [Mycolicibacterium gilvum PYR-GCK]MBV5245374.1 PA-phosphatase [Mycolicibacterium sp. PAM1]
MRWWPFVGLAALVLLGLAVGKGSTPVDDWFQDLGATHPELGRLLIFTDGVVTLTLCAVACGVAAVQRRWRLAVATVATPFLAVMAARLGKRSFGRLKDGEICYPSGHTTLAVVVVAMAVIVAGVTVWAVAAAVTAMLLGVVGQAVSYHYFTDAIGALFLGSAFVCLAVWLGKLDRCQPQGDSDHNPR